MSDILHSEYRWYCLVKPRTARPFKKCKVLFFLGALRKKETVSKPKCIKEFSAVPESTVSEYVSHRPSDICVQNLLHISFLSTWAVDTNTGEPEAGSARAACQSLREDRWHAKINNPAQHHPFCEQMNLLWQYVYERSGDLLSSHLNILHSTPQACCYLWQLGPTLLCALMFNSRTHNQAGRRAWVCWELTGAQELRNSDFL